MPTYEAILDELQDLRTKCLQEPKLATFVASGLEDLDDALRGICAAGERQTNANDQRRQATKELHAHLAKARDLRARIRCGILAFFGPRHPRLLHFSINPRPERRSPAAELHKAL